MPALQPIETRILINTADILYDCWFEGEWLAIRRARDDKVTTFRLGPDAVRRLLAYAKGKEGTGT